MKNGVGSSSKTNKREYNFSFLCSLAFISILLVFTVVILFFLEKIIVFVALSFLFLQARLPPEVNRFLYVRNLPFEITAEEMYDIFGKFGAIRQIRL